MFAVTIRRCAAVAAVALALAAPAGAFEGTVTQRVIAMSPEALKTVLGGEADAARALALTEEQVVAALKRGVPGLQNMVSTIQVKGSKFRVDLTVNGQPGTLLVDAATGTSTIVLPQSKQYLEWTRTDRAAMAKQAAASGPAPTPFPAVTVKALGRKGNINGELCDEFEARDGDRVSIGWVSDAHPELLTTLRDAARAQQGPRPTRQSPMEIFAAKGLPMLVRSYEAGAYEQTDLARITPSTMPDSIFAVPEGYARAELQPTPAAAAATPAAAP